jgi:hypothetical protein
METLSKFVTGFGVVAAEDGNARTEMHMQADLDIDLPI